jgi:arginyl-tRNA synthetase
MVSLTDRIQDIVFSVFPSVSRESWNLDIPPKAGLGDFTIATFLIAKSLKASPMEVSKRLAEAFS